MCSCRRAVSLSFGDDRGPPGHLDKSDFKLPHCSALLASEVTGELQCTLPLPLRPAFGARQTTGADGAKFNAQQNEPVQTDLAALQNTGFACRHTESPVFMCSYIYLV